MFNWRLLAAVYGAVLATAITAIYSTFIYDGRYPGLDFGVGLLLALSFIVLLSAAAAIVFALRNENRHASLFEKCLLVLVAISPIVGAISVTAVSIPQINFKLEKLKEIEIGLREMEGKYGQVYGDAAPLRRAEEAKIAKTTEAEVNRHIGQLRGALWAPSERDPNIKGVQPVLYSTNRKIADVKPTTASSFTYERGSLVFGSALVTIPKAHWIGRVERPNPWYYFFHTTESDAADFRIRDLNLLDRTTFIEALKANPKSTLLFVHGYSVTLADAIFKAAQIAFDANFDGNVVVFSWPAAGQLLGYDHDEVSAQYSADDLVELLKLIANEGHATKLFVVAHSLGNQIVAEALKSVALSHLNLNIPELVMAAPDVDVDVFGRVIARIKQVAGNVTVYASASDRALLASGKKAWGTRLGFITSPPHLFDGVETIDVTAVGTDMLALNHGTFSSSRSVLDDLGRIINSEVHPPNIRSPTLRSIPDKSNPKYWMYPD